MKNKEKILFLIIVLQSMALAGLVFNKPEARVELIHLSLPSQNYAFVADDLDADEKAAFCEVE